MIVENHDPKLANIYERLCEILPKPPHFISRHEIEAMGEDRALEVMRATRRQLLVQLIHQEMHEHMMDDCGDYLQAATENWLHVWKQYFYNDAVDFDRHMREWLLHTNEERDMTTLGGSDGEIRIEMLSEELIEEIYFKED